MKPLRCQRRAPLQRSDRLWPGKSRAPRCSSAPIRRWRRDRPDQTPAKLANHARRKVAAADGRVVDLSCPQRQRKLMALLPVSEVWGIGRRIGKKFEAMGIGTVLQLAESDIRLYPASTSRWCLSERYGSCAASLAWRWRSFVPAKQEITCSRSFGGSHYGP